LLFYPFQAFVDCTNRQDWQPVRSGFCGNQKRQKRDFGMIEF
jgi:predicted ester cyclase